ncbi:MAG: hypothetical protein OHK0039_00080 [Bacteroidia bacterium]
MSGFSRVQDLLGLLYQERHLIAALFEKRNLSVHAAHEGLMALVGEEPERIARLIDRGVLHRAGDFVELEERLLDFFESYLDVGQEISTAVVDENLQLLRQYIDYYDDARSSAGKEEYLRKIKRLLRKLQHTLLRSIIALGRNVKHVYQTEPNYVIKTKKLEDFREKRQGFEQLISQLRHLLETGIFFRTTVDAELDNISVELQHRMREVRTSLLDIQQQIILYLSKIRQQAMRYERLQRIKYLKDQHELRERSNLDTVLHGTCDLLWESRPLYPTRLSIDWLESDEASALLATLGKRRKHKNRSLRIEGPVPADFLREQQEDTGYFDTEALRNAFLHSRKDLFAFLLTYPFRPEPSLEERVTLYCRMVSRYETQIELTDQTGTYEGLTYALAWPAREA